MRTGRWVGGAMALLLAAAVGLLAGCEARERGATRAQLEARIAALERAQADLLPGLGEIMGVLQQHHTKLWYAGQGRNWDLASYQVDEIREGLEDAAKQYPTFGDIPVGKLAPRFTGGALDQLTAAVRGKDPARFAAAYDELSAACSACHKEAKHPFIRLQRPAPGQFSDQVFRP